MNQEISPYIIPGIKLYLKPIIVKVDEKAPEKIEEVVCAYFNSDIETVRKNTRLFEIIVVRNTIMVMLKCYTRLTLAKIGERFEGRNLITRKKQPKDHTSVIHACKTMSDLRDTDESYREDLRNIHKILQEKGLRVINSKYAL